MVSGRVFLHAGREDGHTSALDGADCTPLLCISIAPQVCAELSRPFAELQPCLCADRPKKIRIAMGEHKQLNLRVDNAICELVQTCHL